MFSYANTQFSTGFSNIDLGAAQAGNMIYHTTFVCIHDLILGVHEGLSQGTVRSSGGGDAVFFHHPANTLRDSADIGYGH